MSAANASVRSVRSARAPKSAAYWDIQAARAQAVVEKNPRTVYTLIAAVGIFLVFFLLSPGVLVNLPSMSKHECSKITGDDDCSSDACQKCTNATGGSNFTSPGQAAFHALLAVPITLWVIKSVNSMLKDAEEKAQ